MYPHILSRVGAMPFATLEALRFSDLEALHSYADRRLSKAAVSEEEKKELKAFEEQFETLYQSAILQSRTAIARLSESEILVRGLMQSSHSFVERLSKYREVSASEFRKKERQAERSVAQYLARCCAKTSPFSTFTNLSLNEWDGSAVGEPSEHAVSKFRINNYLLAYLKDLLSNYDPFFVQLELKVNASLHREGEEYVFLLNSRNVESVQRIEVDEVVDKVLEIIEFFKGKVAFRQMVVELTQFVDADAAELGLYILQLQRYGMLEWHWPVSGNDTDWDLKLTDWLKSMKPFTLRGMLVNALELLRKNAEACEIASAAERKKLILESYEAIRDCCAKLKSGQWEEVPAAQNVFAQFEPGEFIFVPERLYYEDSRRMVEMSWPQADLEGSIKELDELLGLLRPLQIDDMALKMQHFYIDHFSEKEQLPLMDFYKAFFGEKEWRLAPELEEILALRKDFCEKLEQQIRYSNDFTVALSLADLRMIIAQKGLENQPPRSSYSYGTLIQFFAEGGTYKSYVDATFTGYGKMLGRFLHLFPTQQTIQLQEWMEALRGTQCWADNVDASIFNANAHPAILPFEISTPGGENRLAPEDQLAISDLTIRWNAALERLQLFRGEEVVTVFDLGLEAIGSRSPMYQLLSVFGKPQPKIGVLKMLLISVSRKEENGWVKLPRINIGDYLVMQRMAWGVPPADQPQRFTSETDAAYFLRVNLWCRRYQLPEKVFITIDPVEFNENSQTQSGEGRGELHKPQYIDFGSPALVSHFGRELAKVEGFFKLEEKLPGENTLLEVNGQATVTELMLMWDGEEKEAKDIRPTL